MATNLTAAEARDVLTFACSLNDVEAKANYLTTFCKRLISQLEAQERAEPVTSDNCGQRITDMLMACADMLGSFPRANVDERAWQHLLVYHKRLGWFLPLDKVNKFVADSIDDLIQRAKGCSIVDVRLRENGEYKFVEADWIKYMEHSHPPAVPAEQSARAELEVEKRRYVDMQQTAYQLSSALKRLSLEAQTTGSVPGRDEGLCVAIAEAERALSLPGVSAAVDAANELIAYRLKYGAITAEHAQVIDTRTHVALPIEPNEESIYAMRAANKGVQRGGIGGQTLDACFRRDHAPEFASYRGLVAHLRSTKGTNDGD